MKTVAQKDRVRAVDVPSFKTLRFAVLEFRDRKGRTRTKDPTGTDVKTAQGEESLGSDQYKTVGGS